MRFRFLPQADEEVIDALRFYDGRVPGLSLRFEEEM